MIQIEVGDEVWDVIADRHLDYKSCVLLVSYQRYQEFHQAAKEQEAEELDGLEEE